VRSCVYQRFEGTCCLHPQGKVSNVTILDGYKGNIECKVRNKRSWRLRQHVPPRRLSIYFQNTVTSTQKSKIWTLTRFKPLNYTCYQSVSSDVCESKYSVPFIFFTWPVLWSIQLHVSDRFQHRVLFCSRENWVQTGYNSTRVLRVEADNICGWVTTGHAQWPPCAPHTLAQRPPWWHNTIHELLSLERKTNDALK
jgi:hypothetical protein